MSVSSYQDNEVYVIFLEKYINRKQDKNCNTRAENQEHLFLGQTAQNITKDTYLFTYIVNY